MNKIKPFLPVYKRAPNKFLRYEERPFDDGVGHTSLIRYAYFLDKSGKEKEMVAQVMWNFPVG